MTSTNLDAPTSDDAGESHDHLATMLAEMDNRLEMLQRELESLAPPVASRTSEQQRAPLRPVADPPAANGAPRHQRLATDLPAGLRTRAPREPAAAARETAPATIQGAAACVPEPDTRPITPETIVRQTILRADEEARRVVENARLCIADIAIRTRALLERSAASPPATPSAAAPLSSPKPEVPTATARARREYEGAVSVEAGPFDDIAQLNAFEAALTSVPGAEDVYIRTFERHQAHFELRLLEPRPLIGELQTRAPDSLRVIEAEDSSIRLEIVRDASDRALR